MDVPALMHAAGHPDRSRILDAIRQNTDSDNRGPSISEIAAICGIDRFATSRHLAVLRAAGMVADVRFGYRREHRLQIEAFETIEDWVTRFTYTFGVDAPGGPS